MQNKITNKINQRLKELEGTNNAVTEKLSEMQCVAMVEGEEAMIKKFFARRTLNGFTTHAI